MLEKFSFSVQSTKWVINFSCQIVENENYRQCWKENKNLKGEKKDAKQHFIVIDLEASVDVCKCAKEIFCYCKK